MLELTPMFFALAVPAVIFAGISKGGFGSGAAFAATPILAIVIDPGLALGVMLPLLMLMDASALKPYWKQWSAIDTRRLILGSFPGVALGALLYTRANDDALRILIGLISIGFVVFQIARGRGLVRPRAGGHGPAAGILAGTVGGFTSFVSHAGGPPVAVYLLSQGLSKTAFQATTVLTFGVVNVLKAAGYVFLGLFTTETLAANLVLAPVAIFGTYLGVQAHRLIPERLFFRITYVLLTLTGTKLIFDAMT